MTARPSPLNSSPKALRLPPSVDQRSYDLMKHTVGEESSCDLSATEEQTRLGQVAVVTD